MDLKAAGIGEGISEVIVTTRSASGKPNAAPIGIITITNEDKNKDKNEQHFVNLYECSKTLSNVRETNKLAANVTDDAVLFVEAAFKNKVLRETHLSLFSRFPVLKEARAWILFESDFVEKSSDFFLFRLEPVAIKINRNKVTLKAINRGLNAVIEAAILATRYNLMEDTKEKEEMEKMVERYADIVEKCGGRREKEAMKKLFTLVYR
jgi:hypothetical protein